GYTVEDVLDTAFEGLHRMEEEMSALSQRMAEGESDPTLLSRYDKLSAAFQSGGGYETDTNKNKVCNGLSISQEMRERPFDMLSGGEKTRVNLARLILEDTDILLLDEPTNHLDLRATEWLEEYLEKFKGTVLAVSHDRYFLDKVVRRVVEIQEGKAEFYSGNYSFYAVEKERRYEEKLRQYEKEQAKIQQLEKAAEQLRIWAYSGNDKIFKRAQSMEKRIERIRQTDKPKKDRKISVRFGEREFRGDEVLSIKSLEKSFGERTLFSGVDLEVEGGERIALLGDNGAGKSTLLKILMGEESPDTGKLRKGPTIRIGYLPQIIHFSHPERSLVDTMLYDLDCTAQTARNRLAAFKFRGEDVFKPVSALSGGEQSRLRLCMLMDSKINLLILDEPTNHLDIQSREWIEEAVEEYEGNLLFVSHDRYFIDRFATRIWMLENGSITDFRGTYQEYLSAKERRALAPGHSAPGGPSLKNESSEKKGKPKRPGGTKNLEKEVAAAERAVAKAEEQMYDLGLQIEEAAADYLKLQELYEQREALEEEILKLYGTWEALSAQLEEARG
ncbi:MAG: ABC-F family ATP-binding cassette domain-containing protein, partial [Lawsonibacter sp.]|nr:ABC-F family ATP-binding cassette domain-containing protein [Lawsonibacter sp.]